MRAIAGMMTAAVAAGLLLGGAVGLVLFVVTDWSEPIVRSLYEQGPFFWFLGTP
ncbi:MULTISPECIES: hypothetical protein [Streptomycetaceae]|uniref:hypothetical protein n=1 Tax=Streptomycetaceae TaxID=2062 RepID=UPI000A8F98C0|nr:MULTISPECIES: hypothetical protein [Streptomycetaceae]